MDFNKFCFINPPTTRQQDEIFFPMGPLVLATLLQQEKIPVELLDFDFLMREHPELRWEFSAFETFALERIASSKADVFGISSICSNFPLALKLGEMIRGHFPEAKIILGGPQPSSVPKDTLERFPYFDAVVVGEGEKTLLDLLHTPWQPEALKKVEGLVFRQGDQVFCNPPRRLIQDLDELPFPDFSLLDLPAYLKITPKPALLEAGRGCPFKCNFCSTAEMWSREYRAKSPSRILAEMNVLNENYGLKDFSLTHDNFTTSPRYVEKFCDYFLTHNERGYTWDSSARTDTLNPERLQKMHQAGCRALFYGVDSGSERIQKIIEKYLNLNGYRKIILESIKRGIQPIGSFIVGFPEEDSEDINETIRLGLWTKAEGAAKIAFHRLSPLASTKVYHHNRDKLFLNGLASDLSFPVCVYPGMIETIQNHPDLFSSFYQIPTPSLGGLDVLRFTNFFTVLGNHFGPTLQWLMEKKRLPPLQVYEEWDALTEDSPLSKKLDPAFIVETFTDQM